MPQDIVINPYRGSVSSDATIVFTDSSDNSINLRVLEGGTLSFEGTSGQLFSITDSLTGTIFSVNDISGIPSIEVDDDGTIRLAEFSGNVLIGTAVDTTDAKLQLQGNLRVSGDLDVSNITIDDAGTIGSVSDPDAITISSAGLVTFSAGTKGVTESFIVALSDETTALTTGTGKASFRMPYAFTLTAVRASVSTAPVGSTIIVDINENGTTILSTKLSIDASEKTSTTAATAAVISDSALADDAEITFDIDQVGSSTAGAGLKVTFIGYQS